MSSIPQRFYIYTLAYPPEMGGTIFYVGKGQGYRINQHEREARLHIGYNPYKENVIRKIWRHGYEIMKEKVAFFDDEKDAFLYEQFLIASLGRENLTNLTEGGEGVSGITTSVKSGRHQTRRLTVFGKLLLCACDRHAKRLEVERYSWSQLARDSQVNRAIITDGVCGKTTPTAEKVWKLLDVLTPDSELEHAICASLAYSTRQEAEQAIADIDEWERLENIV